jgi:hypothetical protein
MSIPHALDIEIYRDELKKSLNTASPKNLYQSIVDAPFIDRTMTARMGLGIVVLLLINHKENTIDRIALARTDLAKGTLDMTTKPFKEIKIPLNDRNNYIAIAIRRKHHMATSDWQYLFMPALSAEEARMNQAGGGIAGSIIYPLDDTGETGAMIFSYYEPLDRIEKYQYSFMSFYSRLAGSLVRKLNA